MSPHSAADPETVVPSQYLSSPKVASFLLTRHVGGQHSDLTMRSLARGPGGLFQNGAQEVEAPDSHVKMSFTLQVVRQALLSLRRPFQVPDTSLHKLPISARTILR
jgi:hypothetical protein